MPRVKKPAKVKEPIRLRMKELANGNKSLYLDIYRDGKRTSRMRQFKNRVGLKNAYSKFQKLIADFDFASLEAIDRRIDWSTVRIINL